MHEKGKWSAQRVFPHGRYHCLQQRQNESNHNNNHKRLSNMNVAKSQARIVSDGYWVPETQVGFRVLKYHGEMD